MIRTVTIQPTAVTGSIKTPLPSHISIPAEPWDTSAYTDQVFRDRSAALAPSARRVCGCGKRIHLRNAQSCDDCRAAEKIERVKGAT